MMLLAAGGVAAAQEKPVWQIRARDDSGVITHDPATGLTTGTNGVIITYQDVILTADSVTADQATGDVIAEGNVTIKGRSQLWVGERVSYNLNNGRIFTPEFKTGSDPIYIKGESLNGDQSNNVYFATNVIFTTDNVADPAHVIRAKNITVVPDQYIIARDATLYIGSVPVFYLPYYKRGLGRHPNNFQFVPGYRSLYGPYLLSSYNWYWSEQLSGAVNLDWRQKRGLAGGPDFMWSLDRFGAGNFRYYYARDKDPGLDDLGRPIDKERDRLQFSHRINLRTNLTVKGSFNYQSDPFILRDFFEDEYRENIQPKTFLEVEQLWPNFTLDVLAQPRINDFWETVERLPDIKFSALRQRLGVSPFYYEGENSFGYYQRRFAYNLFPEYSAYRGDSFHQLLLPQNYFGWLNVTPKVGGRLTYYSEAEGPGATTTDTSRGVFNTGVEVGTKASRVWRGAENKFFEIKELRHIFEPLLNYVWIPEPHPRPPRLPQFDYEIPTHRLLPIDFPEYNSIDSIDAQHAVRFTLLNRLQTKRFEQIANVVDWALYTDWYLNPRTNQNTFSDYFSDLILRPRSWLTMYSQTRFDLDKGTWKEAYNRFTFHPGQTWSFSLGHYLLNDPLLSGPGNNLFTTSLYYKFNENWAGRISHRFEARDGQMEEQQYTIYRDLRSWTSALTFRTREARNGETDYSVAITFSIKAFPRYNLGQDRDYPSTLLGR